MGQTSRSHTERNYFSSCTFTQTANSPVDENFPSVKTLWRKLTWAHLSGNSLATVFTIIVLLTFSLKGSRLWCRATLDRPELVQLEMVSAWFELKIFFLFFFLGLPASSPASWNTDWQQNETKMKVALREKQWGTRSVAWYVTEEATKHHH